MHQAGDYVPYHLRFFYFFLSILTTIHFIENFICMAQNFYQLKGVDTAILTLAGQ